MALSAIEAMVAQGMGRVVTVGAFSTGIVGGGAGTVLDLDQPELAIGVPAGYFIRPIFVSVSVQPGITTADSDEVDAMIGVDSLGLWSGDGTSTAENPSNMRTDLDKGSACRVGSAFTADMTTTPGNGGSAADPVIDLEIDHATITMNFGDATGISGHEAKILYQPNYPLYLVGPCTFLAYWGGTIATVGGFATVMWVEAPVSQLQSLAGL